MGLLRAFADAVVVGAGTVRAEGSRALWTSGFIFPAAADDYRTLRQTLKRAPEPRLVIITARGELNPSARALQEGALVITTAAAALRLKNSLPASTEVRGISSGDRLDVRTVFDVLRADGHRTILTEGGPQLFGEMVAEQLVDELFLTVSPNLIGHAAEESFGIMHRGTSHRHLTWSRLLSVRLHESHLFLRYALNHSSASPLWGG